MASGKGGRGGKKPSRKGSARSARTGGKGRAGSRTGSATKSRRPARAGSRRTERAGKGKRPAHRSGPPPAIEPAAETIFSESPPPPSATIDDKALTLFEKGVRAFMQKEWDRAEGQFQKILDGFPMERELGARATMYLQALQRQRDGEKRRAFRSSEEMTQAAVVLMNQGNPAEAAGILRRCLDRVKEEGRSSKTRADLVHYLLASALALASDPEGALAHLRKAIALGEGNRTAALNNPDFDTLREDPRFHALLRPHPWSGNDR